MVAKPLVLNFKFQKMLRIVTFVEHFKNAQRFLAVPEQELNTYTLAISSMSQATVKL